MSRKRQPPSRIRYAEENPTIGIHVTREERERLRTLSRHTGLSVSKLVKHELHILEANIETVRKHCLEEGIAKGQRIGRVDGRREGYAEAMALYGITILCSNCGEPIAVLPASEIAADAATTLSQGVGVTCSAQSQTLPQSRRRPCLEGERSPPNAPGADGPLMRRENARLHVRRVVAARFSFGGCVGSGAGRGEKALVVLSTAAAIRRLRLIDGAVGIQPPA
jgi:predicted DNA-binding protein